jgi:hypothetical protein
MYQTTGFTKDQIVELCALISAVKVKRRPLSGRRFWRLFNSVVVTLIYLRRNRVQAEMGEAFGVSQPTISRAVTTLTDVLGRVVADYVPVVEDLDSRTRYIMDGTLLPCWSWRGQRQWYSGKHKTTGMNVQVDCDLHGPAGSAQADTVFSAGGAAPSGNPPPGGTAAEVSDALQLPNLRPVLPGRPTAAARSSCPTAPPAQPHGAHFLLPLCRPGTASEPSSCG